MTKARRYIQEVDVTTMTSESGRHFLTKSGLEYRLVAAAGELDLDLDLDLTQRHRLGVHK